MRRTKHLFTAMLLGTTVAILFASSSALAQGCGDPDGDGNITDVDGVNALRAAASLSSNCTLPTCDVNADGVINDVDGVNLLRAAAQLPATLNCPQPIGDFVEDVETEDGVPTLQIGAAPIPGQGAPDTIGDIEGDTTAVAGGSNTVTIPYDASAQAGAAQVGGLSMVIAINSETRFAHGYFEIPLSELAGTITITVVFPESLGEGTFLLCPATLFQGSLSQYGALEQVPVQISQLSPSLYPSQDLALHLVEPNDGEKTIFGHPTAAAELTFVLHKAALATSKDGSFNPVAAGAERLFRVTYRPAA